MSSTDKTIGQKIRELNHLDMKARMEWSKKYSMTPEAQAINVQIMELRKECEAVGHVAGEFHNNGLYWHWWICSECGASFDKEYHGPEHSEDEVTFEE